jgi:hypothetical protein
MEAVPIALFWILSITAFLGKSHRLLYLFFCSMPFGSFAVIPPELTAGLTLTPTPIVALMIFAQQCLGRRRMERAISLALTPKHLLLLFIFWIVCVFTTVFMPRLFAAKVMVIPMRLEDSTYGEALYPTSQNISQLAYLTISVAVVFAFAQMLRSSEMRRHAVYALVAGGLTVVVTGFLDYLAQFAPISPLLEPFRTATYALITEAKVQGAKRIVGLMPEASAYGGLALTFLAAIYFFRRSLTSGFFKNLVVPTVLILLVLFIWLSTSSSAYVGFGAFCFVVVLEWLHRATKHGPRNTYRQGLAIEFWIMASIGMCVCAVALFKPSLMDPFVRMVDEMVFQKTSSSSFEERSMWTAVSWQALLDSYGLGVGLGGTRASNGVVSMFSSVGFIGGFLYFAFLFQTFFLRAPTGDALRRVASAATFWSFLPTFVAVVLAGTTPDFGTFNGFLFGMALAVSLPVRGPPSRSGVLGNDLPGAGRTAIAWHLRQ